MGSVLSGAANALGNVFGSIGGGVAEGAGATNQFNAQNPYSSAVLQDQLNKQAEIYSGQKNLAQALQQQMAGQGPNPAQTQYMGNVQNNIANTQGLIASQRGLNPALAARLGANVASDSNQKAAMQSSLLQQQQQLGATQNLGNLYGQLQQGNLGYQQLYNQANQGAAGLNQQTSGQNAQIRGQVAGSLMNAAGSAAAAGAAHGGFIGGQANVPGDSPANDTVPVRLSPDEIVVPRSMAHSPEAAKSFIEALFKSQGGETDDVGYGKVLKARQLKKKTEQDVKKMADGGFVDSSKYGQTESSKDPTLDAIYKELAQANATQDVSAGAAIPLEKSKNKDLVIEPVVEAVREPAANPIIIEPADPVLAPTPQAQMQQPQLSVTQPQPIAQAPAAPANPVPGAEYAQAFAQKESGIKQMADAQSQAAKAQAGAYQAQATQIADAQKRYQDEHSKLDAEHKQLIDATLNQKIDPNRVYNNMGTGNKILAAISVGLSGLGAGLQGPGAKNMAMEVIQKTIDRDIEAQKMELGKKQTLLSENVRRFGDLNTATQATMLQLNAMTQAKVAQAAAQAASPQAQAQAKVMLGDLGLQAAAIKAKIAESQSVASFRGGGLSSDAKAQGLPKEERERAVKIGNKYVPAIDEASAKEARKIVGANDALISNLDKLIALREKHGQETIPGPVKAEMQTIATSLQLAIKEAKSLGTLDKGAEKFMDKLVADPTSIGFVSSQYKALRDAQLRESAQRLKALGIDASGLSGQSETPIKTVNGVKYKRGPNGEAIEVK